MRVLGSLMLCLSVVALAAVGAEGKKPASNAEKIVGKWKVVKSDAIPLGNVVEFTKDGKMRVTGKRAGGQPLSTEGTYKVQGNKLILTLKGAGGKELSDTATIKVLTDTKLILADAKGEADEFKRVK
jgi:uncharacterized protein (TIGR03066 family)